MKLKALQNGLCCVKIISDDCGKMCASFKIYICKKTTQLTPTTQLKRQQRNHLYQHHLNITFSQHLTFSNRTTPIVHFFTSTAEANPKERRCKSRSWIFLFTPAAFRSIRVAGWIISNTNSHSVSVGVWYISSRRGFVACKRQVGSLYFGDITT